MEKTRRPILKTLSQCKKKKSVSVVYYLMIYLLLMLQKWLWSRKYGTLFLMEQSRYLFGAEAHWKPVSLIIYTNTEFSLSVTNQSMYWGECVLSSYCVEGKKSYIQVAGSLVVKH